MKAAPSVSMAKEEKRWRAESDLRTLTDAGEIQRDKSRIKAAQGIAKKQLRSLRKIAGRRS
jgi:hypothetical protein